MTLLGDPAPLPDNALSAILKKTRDRALTLAAQGLSYARAGQWVGCVKSAIGKWLRRGPLTEPQLVGKDLSLEMYECMAAHIISNMNAYQATGQAPGRTRAAALGPGLSLRAADGYVVLAGVRSPQRLAALWDLVGHPDLPQQDDRYLQQFPDADFVFDEMIPAIEEWSAQRPKWEVAGRLTEIGFSMGVAQSVSDLADCPQLAARGMYVDTADTLGGTFRALATPIQLTACRKPDAAAPPTLGQHNAEILCGIGGLTAAELALLGEEGAV